MDILNRWTGAVLYHSETANTIAEAVKDANLSGADLSGADLSGADLSGADLSGADLSRAYLSGADLSGADLSRADLSRAYLSGADLSGAYLSGANLSGAYLSGAYLSGADLSGAYLSGADLSGANLSDIKQLPLLAMLQIQGTQHCICVWSRQLVTVGCERHSLEWWLKHFKATGEKHDYSTEQIEEYGDHLRYAESWIEKREKCLGKITTAEKTL